MRRLCVKYAMPVVITLLMVAAGWGLACAMLEESDQVIVDCRGRMVDVETVRQWEKQEKDGYLGLVGIAGWRIENQAEAVDTGTGKKVRTKVTGIYGPMDMVYPAKILSGSYGLAAEDGYCVLSVGLAYELFGNTDVTGETVRYDGEILKVAGVIDKKEKYLLVPVKEGRIEQLALRFKSRWKTEDKVEELLGGV